MAHTIHEQWNEGWTVNKKRRRGEEEDEEQTETEETGRRGRRGTDGNRGDLPKIGDKFRKLPHGGGDTGRTPLKISLG